MPKSQLAVAPAMLCGASPRGLVSGQISAKPNSAARRCAPALIMKVSSLQVNPAKYSKAGTAACLVCGGR